MKELSNIFDIEMLQIVKKTNGVPSVGFAESGPDQIKLPMRNADAFSPYGHWI